MGKNLQRLILPKGAGIIEVTSVTSSSKLVGIDFKPDTGILKAAEDAEWQKYVNKKVRFREVFSEEIAIEGESFLYFRDLSAGIFFIDADE